MRSHGGSEAVTACTRGHSRTFVLQIGTSGHVYRARACPTMPRLMYPSRTRESLSVRETSNTCRSDARAHVSRSRWCSAADQVAVTRVAALPALVAAQLLARPWLGSAGARHRSGRHVEALEVYEGTRRDLDDLGLRPGEELRRLAGQIVRQEPHLRTPAQTVPARDGQRTRPMRARRLSALVLRARP
jgi:hypothetical protein